MPKITLIEADNLLCFIEEQLQSFREIKNQLINPRITQNTVTEIDSIPEVQGDDKEVVETQKTEVVENGLKYTLDDVHQEIEKLLLKKSRIETAVWEVKSTYKFEF